MSFTPWLPPELWLLVFQFSASYPSPGSIYIPFELLDASLALEEGLKVRRSLVLVCKHWRALATHILYEDVRIRHGSVLLKERLTGSRENIQENYGRFVHRIVLPYTHTATSRQHHIAALDILQECPKLEILVRSHRDHLDNLQWNFPAPCVSLRGLKRLDWWHYNDAARTGGINSFHDVLQRTPHLRYLSIGGELWLSFAGAEPINLPELETLRLGRMNMLFVQLICRWSLPSLTHLVLDDNRSVIEGIWDKFGAGLQVVEFGARFRFFIDDHISTILNKCTNLTRLNYCVMFMAGSGFPGTLPSITSFGLHAHPCGLFEPGDESTIEQVNVHLTFVSGPSFPGLRQLVFYGNWKPFRNTPQFLNMEKSVSARGVTVVIEQDL